MLSGIVVFLAVFFSFLFLSLKKGIDFPVIFSFSVTLPSIACLLYYLYLLFPGNSHTFYRIFLLTSSILFFIFSFIYYSKNGEKGRFKPDLWFLIPVFVSSIIFVFTARFYPDYDPLSYALIGKTVFKYSSLSHYPFVEKKCFAAYFFILLSPPGIAFNLFLFISF
ncbi:hypothetical protein TTHT_0212 [Thermotomaculum hydrothermale]|uniref:Uncharacterized protein n=1 Tax=Thermotomaculum hydrothermale TaxID=981385 RepID=A0A7R6PLM0_9BACT|nr:hypothetical protein [Thermotomaculum hydrothermale]BBB31838.1 hypothetical protein TTHT_0212 [Thermotomaculum hydrothermale]